MRSLRLLLSFYKYCSSRKKAACDVKTPACDKIIAEVFKITTIAYWRMMF